MKRVLSVGGVIIILISFLLLYRNIIKKNIELFGKEVIVEVIDVPISCDISNKNLKAFFRFQYNNKIYTKNLKNKYCELVKTNKTLKLKTNSDNTIFIYIDEDVNQELFFNFILLAFGCIIFYKSKKHE
jgi:hypothetical protein